MFSIYGLSNDRAQIVCNQAKADDLQITRIIAQAFCARGLIARICREGYNGDEVLEELAP